MSESKNSKKIKRQVFSPTGEFLCMTSLARCRRYVRRKLAKWDGIACRMLANAGVTELDLDIRQFPVDFSFYDGRAVLRFWSDQRSPGRGVAA